MNHYPTKIYFAFFLLLFAASAVAQSVVRGPYLQQQTDSSINIRWRTDLATDSVVRYGLTSTSLNSTASLSATRTEHSITVTGLSAHTQYFYSVGDSIGTIAGNGSYHFHTAPLIGSATATRFWAIGDAGTAVTHPGLAASVRDAFKTYTASSPADFMVMLGDNAYSDGTDTEYQNAVFNTYPELLRQLPVWSTLGNHDGHNADSASQTGPYYDIFDPPINGEIGGYPSGTEAYYSFDYGEVHFVCLDSYDSPRGINGTMMTWLESDLAENHQPWVIAYWHHPPYSKGSHNSDSSGENRMTDMRQNFLPILEAWGVDLVLSGHSHSYERSFLLDGHYGLSGSLDLSDPSVNVLDWGDGSETGNGVYQKPGIIAAENEGTVYIVAGSSGKVTTTALNHPAMFVGLANLGSLVVDVVGNRLDAAFIDETGLVRDEFTILKSPDLDPPIIMNARAEDGTHVIVEYSEHVNIASASDLLNYSVSGLGVSNAAIVTGNKSARLTTGAMTPGNSYTVTVNNVTDDEGNTILPNSQFTFDFVPQLTLSFQDGLAPDPSYDGTFDAYIREATPNTNYGTAATLQVDGDEPSGAGTDMSIVIGWDISDIPATATVDSASIYFNTLNVGGTYYCFALLRGWNENEVSWNQATSGTSWATPGAEGATDSDSLPLCSINAGSTGPIEINLNSDGVALVQSWVDGSLSSNGMVIADSVSTNGADFDSSESSTAMSRPRLEVTYTVPVAPPNQAPTASFSHSCTDLSCNFTDTSTDSDGSVVGWSWDFGDGNFSSDQNPVHSFVSDGDYTVELTVTDDEGAMDTTSKLVTVSIPPLFTNVLANADLFGSGTVSGTFNNTRADDGDPQTITERESGGKKQNRYSFMVHTWRFSVPANAMATVHANTWSGGSADDNFRFSWSTDNSNYSELFIVAGNDTDLLNLESFTLPPNTNGTVYIRVEDTDQTAGNRAKDQLLVDHLYIRAESGSGGGDPPAAPTELIATANGASQVNLAWTDNAADEAGFKVERSPDGIGFTEIDTTPGNQANFIDSGLLANTSYWYRVRAWNAYGDSPYSNVVSVTTDAESAITLGLTGYKIKGKHNIDLAWSETGASDVDIYRDGNLLVTITYTGEYTDSTSNKGGRTYIYQVCKATTGNCSAIESVTF